MTKLYYKCNEDNHLIHQSFNNLAFLIFGKNNEQEIRNFDNHFERRVERVEVQPRGTITESLNYRTPGICRYLPNGNLSIEMWGYANSKPENYSWIKHEGTHEFCHAFVDLLPEVKSKHKEGYVSNGILRKNFGGMIEELNPRTRQRIKPGLYGKMFNETSMDIISSIAINNFDSNGNGVTADEILNTNYKNWGNQETGYSFWTSITRLTIAAFSNNPNTNYQDIINKGYSMFDIETVMNNGETYKANDFLYGIVFDPIHIEKEFDKFVGEDCYRKFCECLDLMFLESLENKKIEPENVKIIMNILPDFLNNKINYYRENGIISMENSNKIIGNFNRIWNSMQTEYNAYFSQQDINDIASRANKNQANSSYRAMSDEDIEKSRNRLNSNNVTSHANENQTNSTYHAMSDEEIEKSRRRLG